MFWGKQNITNTSDILQFTTTPAYIDRGFKYFKYFVAPRTVHTHLLGLL